MSAIGVIADDELSTLEARFLIRNGPWLHASKR
jgi:hypothetical protein